jgi:hypothetical protein
MYNWKYVAAILSPLLFIFPYGKFRCNNKTFKDPLEKEIVLGLDGWSASHFTFFLIIGYIYPKSFIPTMLVGIAWESFEHLYGKHRPGWLGGYGDCNDMATDKEDGNWWYGKWTDIACNCAGFLIGQHLRYHL